VVTSERVRVVLETAHQKSFASALDWPGWSRSGKTPDLAVEALLEYAPRFAPVAAAAGQPLPDGIEAHVVETVEGDVSTNFGVPGRVARLEKVSLGAAEAGRRAALVVAAWTAFDRIAAAAPAELRKGPRGGGRDTAKVVEHVVLADHGYTRELGIRVPAPDPAERASIERLREAMLEVLRRPSEGGPIAKRWTARYAARRIAWHALDHAWEIEDRTEP
jgi:hypothetical protein